MRSQGIYCSRYGGLFSVISFSSDWFHLDGPDTPQRFEAVDFKNSQVYEVFMEKAPENR